MDMAINDLTMFCIHTDQWLRIRAVPVNATAVIRMLNYLLWKSSLASEIAIRDHMYHNEIYLCRVCCLYQLVYVKNPILNIEIYLFLCSQPLILI